MMRWAQWAFRPWALIVISAALVGLAALVALRPARGDRPRALELSGDDQEVAWLYPATSTTTWARFLTAVEYACQRLQPVYPGLRVEHAGSATGSQASKPTSTPEIVLSWPQAPGRLRFRWYKLTGDWKAGDWIDAFSRRGRMPLAVVGGNNSEWGRKLALALRLHTARLPETQRPLLLLTTATADTITMPEDWPAELPVDAQPAGDGRDCSEPEGPKARPFAGQESQRVPLTGVYPGRTFRFGFTNRQMATASTRFIWGRPELRPDADPAYLVQWQDDPYSVDLLREYRRVLPCRALDAAGEEVLLSWGRMSGAVASGLHPAALAQPSLPAMRYEWSVPLAVDSSVGLFAAPNPFEARVVGLLLEHAEKFKGRDVAPRRLLLVVAGQTQPARRFLRDLARSAPETARRFVVTMGDALAFNTIYRDRQVTWPIQDLPFPLVLFCHRNPIDRQAGFRPAGESAGQPGAEGDPGVRQTSGTEDLLLFSDVVETLALVFHRGGATVGTPEEVGKGLLSVRLCEGRLSLGGEGEPLFRADGQRNPGTGEHVVYLIPEADGERVRPRATIEVWERLSSRGWRMQGAPLVVGYDDALKFAEEPGKGGN